MTPSAGFTGSGPTLEGRRVLVVGASSGIGLSFARSALDQGAHVALCARRADRLEAAVVDSDNGHAIPADVTRAPECAALADAVARHLGGLDLLLYAVGAAPLSRIEELDAEVWHQVLATNVVGASLVTAAALPHLVPGAVCAYLSSISSNRPYWALGAYTTSKAALNQLVASWRVEHPAFRFTRVVMGNTAPTEFGDGFDRALLDEALPRWGADGIRPFEIMEASDVGAHLAQSLAVALAHPAIELQELRLEAPASPGPAP